MNAAERRTWLEWRSKGLGGSDVAALLGLSPWATPFDVWYSKVEPFAMEDNDDAVKSRGRWLERAVGEWLADDLGMVLLDADTLQHPVHEWARGTPDFWVAEHGAPIDGADGAECKTSRYLDGEWGPHGSDIFPDYYRTQCYWYTAISDAPRWHLGVFGTTQEKWQRYVIERDPPLLDRLLNHAGEWWERYVVKGEPPAVDSSDSAQAWLRHRHSDSSGEVRDATREETMLLAEYRNAKTAEKAAKASAKEIGVKLKAAIGDDKGVRVEGFGGVSWSRFERSSFALKRFEKEHPELSDIIATYKTTKPTDRLNPKWED